MKKKLIAGLSFLCIVLIAVFFYNVNEFNREQKKWGEEKRKKRRSFVVRNYPYWRK